MICPHKISGIGPMGYRPACTVIGSGHCRGGEGGGRELDGVLAADHVFLLILAAEYGVSREIPWRVPRTKVTCFTGLTASMSTMVETGKQTRKSTAPPRSKMQLVPEVRHHNPFFSPLVHRETMQIGPENNWAGRSGPGADRYSAIRAAIQIMPCPLTAGTGRAIPFLLKSSLSK